MQLVELLVRGSLKVPEDEIYPRGSRQKRSRIISQRVEEEVVDAFSEAEKYRLQQSISARMQPMVNGKLTIVAADAIKAAKFAILMLHPACVRSRNVAKIRVETKVFVSLGLRFSANDSRFLYKNLHCSHKSKRCGSIPTCGLLLSVS